MRALLFGSIGTLADTSELQRQAFNQAFAEHGLNWNWSRDQYRGLLRQSGGRRRIELQAQMQGETVNARAIHATKNEIFQKALQNGEAKLRPGVDQAMRRASQEGAQVGLVTATSRLNVIRLLDCLKLESTVFDVLVSEDDITSGKPAADCYQYALACLGIPSSECIAIEDNTDGVRAARRAGIACLAWPGENTVGHEFPGARLVQDDLLTAIWPRVPVAAE
jgi:HAD superfamily hydrolase (TIGR01509 family)